MDSSVVNGTTYYYTVTAENGNGEGRPRMRSSCTPAAAAPRAAATHDRRLRPPRTRRSPTQAAGRTGSPAPSKQASRQHKPTLLHPRHHLHRLAKPRHRRPRHRSLGTYHSPARHHQPTPPLRPPPTTKHRRLRRLHAPHPPTRRTRRALPRTHRQRQRCLAAHHEPRAHRGRHAAPAHQGPTLEVWRHDSTTWTRLGTTQDTTYTTPGNSGIGLRGTTGRLDDFGTRTLGNAAA